MDVQYLVDKTGQKTGVFLSIKDFTELLERLEDVEAAEMLRKLREKPIEFIEFNDFLTSVAENV